MSSTFVHCDDVEVTFGDVLALPRTSLHIDGPESVALMGPSGSGKSTLLRCIEGLQRPTAGSVSVLGQDLGRASRARKADLRRRHMGLVFQGPELLPEFSTVENVAFTLLFDGVKRADALKYAAESLEAVGLSNRAGADVRTLSGGEAQRVAVARALVRPEVRLVIADEPTASLDADNALLVTELLLARAQVCGAAVLLATHDPAVAALCDRTHRLARHAFAA